MVKNFLILLGSFVYLTIFGIRNYFYVVMFMLFRNLFVIFMDQSLEKQLLVLFESLSTEIALLRLGIGRLSDALEEEEVDEEEVDEIQEDPKGSPALAAPAAKRVAAVSFNPYATKSGKAE